MRLCRTNLLLKMEEIKMNEVQRQANRLKADILLIQEQIHNNIDPEVKMQTVNSMLTNVEKLFEISKDVERRLSKTEVARIINRIDINGFIDMKDLEVARKIYDLYVGLGFDVYTGISKESEMKIVVK